jgi:hypothetical protein
MKRKTSTKKSNFDNGKTNNQLPKMGNKSLKLKNNKMMKSTNMRQKNERRKETISTCLNFLCNTIS